MSEGPREEQYRFTAHGIAVMTAFAEENGHALPAAVMADIADEHGEMEVMIGLANVATWLLVKLENATGQTAREILQDIARRNKPPR